MHPANEELESYRMGRLTPSQSSIVRAHLLECDLCAAKLEPERRRRVRTPKDQPASIRVIGPSVTAPVAARILDASEGGMKLAVPESLEPGTFLQVRLDTRFVLAEVRYCLRHGNEFHVGVEAKDVFKIPGKEESG